MLIFIKEIIVLEINNNNNNYKKAKIFEILVKTNIYHKELKLNQTFLEM